MVTLHNLWAPFAAIGAAALFLLAYLIFRLFLPAVLFPPLPWLTSAAAVRRSARRPPRNLCFASLCLLLAGLFFGRPRFEPRGGGDRALIVLVDASASMQGAPFAEALATARRRLAALKDGDAANVAAVGPKVVWALPHADVSGNRSVLWRFLDRLEPTCGGARFDSALREASEKLFSSGFPEKELVIVSDFQESTWRHAEKVLNDLLRSDIDVQLKTAGEENRENLALQIPRPVVVTSPGIPVLLRAHLKAFARREITCRVSWKIGDKSLETTSLTLPPEGTAKLRLPIAPSESGVLEGVVSLRADQSMTFDDTARFSVIVLPKVLAAVAVHEPQQAVLIKEALSAAGEAGRLQALLLRELGRRKPQLYVAVSPAPSYLQEALQEGIPVLLFAGSRPPALPELRSTLRQSGLWLLLPEIAGHTTDRIEALSQLRIRMRRSSPQGALTLCRFSDGRPAVVLFRDLPLLVCLFDASGTSSPLLQTPQAVVPLLGELVYCALSAPYKALIAGEPATLVLPQRAYRFYGTAGEEFFPPAAPRGRSTTISLPAQTKPGFVRIFSSGRLVASLPVGQPEEESDPKRAEDILQQAEKTPRRTAARPEVDLTGPAGAALILVVLLWFFLESRTGGSTREDRREGRGSRE